jgi:hypothetical protein
MVHLEAIYSNNKNLFYYICRYKSLKIGKNGEILILSDSTVYSTLVLRLCSGLVKVRFFDLWL